MSSIYYLKAFSLKYKASSIYIFYFLQHYWGIIDKIPEVLLFITWTNPEVFMLSVAIQTEKEIPPGITCIRKTF